MTEPVRKYLTEDEVQRLLVRDADPTDRLLVQLGLSLGCRVSEITSLKIKWINGQVIKIWDEKKNENRHCVIDKDTSDLLQDYLRDHWKVPQGYTRERQRLFYFSDRTANRKIKRAFQVAGVDASSVPWRFHTLRHTYVRRMLDRLKDRSIQFICQQTGNSPMTILGYYGVPSIDERLKVADDYPVIR